jgi:hypothetical protein
MRWLLLASGIVLLILAGAAATPSFAPRVPGVPPEVFRALALVLVACALFTCVLAVMRRGVLATAAVALSIATAAGVIIRTVLPVMDAHISARTASQVLRGHQYPKAGAVSVHQLHRAWHYGLNYYLRQDVQPWSPEHDTAFIVTSEAGLHDLRAKKVEVVAEWITRRAIIADRREISRRPAGIDAPNY